MKRFFLLASVALLSGLAACRSSCPAYSHAAPTSQPITASAAPATSTPQ